MPTAIDPIWQGAAAIVAATGPSLTPDVAAACNTAHKAGTHRLAAVNDAYKLLEADLLYACDAAWWTLHKGAPSFAGQKWSSQHHKQERGQPANEKRATAQRYGIRLVEGRHADGFCFDSGLIHYGSNSGFQAINLVLQLGATSIVLVGFDMQHVGGKRHFFGNHPAPLNNRSNYSQWAPIFAKAAAALPPHIKIVNATLGSAIKCFPFVQLNSALGLLEHA